MRLEQTRATLASQGTPHVPCALVGCVLVWLEWCAASVSRSRRPPPGWCGRGPARAVAVRCVAPLRSRNTSPGWTTCASHVPRCL
jgi:hypothetical protein